MDYSATLEHLYRLERFGIKLGLENIRRLLSLLGDPHRGLKVVHVTGTNGKGSVCAYVASVLRAAGYRVGLYTSPHLIRFNERIRVDGEPIADQDVLRLWGGMQPAIQAMTSVRAIDHPTFFEVTTAMAFEYFRERGTDVAVIEVGMGGRMDATNVVDGLVSVVTRVDLEHTEHLGKTVDRIAREKAGIIKPTSRAVTVAQDALPVIETRCREVHAPLCVVGRDVVAERTSFDLRGQGVRIRGLFGVIDVRTPLLGAFQVENVAVAVAALTELRRAGFAVPDDAVLNGIRSVRWSARLEVVRETPTVIVDGAHNRPAAVALATSFRELFPDRKAVLITGILNDKDLPGIAAALGPMSSEVYACRAKTHRAFEPEEIAAAFRPFAPTTVIPGVLAAIDTALSKAQPTDIILITGSIYTAGEALEHLGVRP
ncbi:MAG TPA: folylpolyglutamate synthase/dihydrofolate synthase family protein [Thermoplasmata archaeon]|nr:folylpolyglutamate synthase/dihydrofolate synthase family protein [Thermoplasmata archaeon]